MYKTGQAFNPINPIKVFTAYYKVPETLPSYGPASRFWFQHVDKLCFYLFKIIGQIILLQGANKGI